MDKVANHSVFVRVRYEFSHYFDKDEDTYRKAYNMTSLSKCFKKKISTSGGKARNIPVGCYIILMNHQIFNYRLGFVNLELTQNIC